MDKSVKYFAPLKQKDKYTHSLGFKLFKNMDIKIKDILIRAYCNFIVSN